MRRAVYSLLAIGALAAGAVPSITRSLGPPSLVDRRVAQEEPQIGSTDVDSLLAGVPTVRNVVAAGEHRSLPGIAREVTSATGGPGEGFAARLTISAGSWFDPSDDGPIQRDGRDWNKLAGLHWTTGFATVANHRNSALLAYRPAPSPDSFELAFYQNPPADGFRADALGTVAADSAVEVVARCTAGTWTLHTTLAADTLTVVSEVDRDAWVRWNVNTWFGGNRVAPVRQEVSIRFAAF